jgi:ribonuclease HI
MRKTNWKMKIRLVKVHVGIRRNELADTLAKDAATNEDITESKKKVPKSVVFRKLEEINVEK